MTKPTDGVMLPCPFCGEDAKSIAIRDGRQVFCTGCHAKGPPAYHGPANIPPTQKRAIDGWNYREAVAPAVRELVETLGKINDTGPVWSSRPDYAEALEHSRAVFARYRHLIEESGE